MKHGTKLRKGLAGLLLTGLLLTLGACGSKEEEETVLRIGIFEPLTGGNASYGNAEKLGIEYAHSLTPTITMGGKTYNIELIAVDNAATPPADAARKLLDAGVSVVLGSYGNEVSAIGGQIFGEAGVAVIGISCTDPALTNNNDYFFRVCSRPNAQASALGAYAYDRLDAESAYCISVTDDTESLTTANAFAYAFHSRGGRVYLDEVSATSPDLVTCLVRADDEAAQAIFAPLPPDQIVQLVTLSRSLGLQMPILGPDMLDSRQILEIPVDEQNDGPAIRVYVSAFYTAEGNSSFDEGLRRYVGYNARTASEIEDPVSSYAALGYDAYQIAVKAALAAKSTNKADILAVMPSIVSTGVTGTVSFLDNGDALRDTVYVKRADYVNQKWRLDRKQEIPQ